MLKDLKCVYLTCTQFKKKKSQTQMYLSATRVHNINNMHKYARTQT